MLTKELIIIGAKTAGLAAAVAAHKHGCREIYVFEHEENIQTTWPALPGLHLETSATVLSLNERRQITVTGPHVGYQQFQTKAVILATGSIPSPSPDSSNLLYRPDVSLCHNAGIALSPISGGPVLNEMRETSLQGVFACGDILFLHEDSSAVAQEGAQAGTCASLYLKQGFFRKPVFPIEASGLLIYTVPSFICPKNLAETLSITLCTSQPGSLLRIFRDHILWKEIPWPCGQLQRQARICLDKKDLLSLHYRLTFELKA